MPLFLVTGNAGKFREIQTVVPAVQQLDIDLREIQEVDAKAIIREKLAEARKHHPHAELLVEDTSLYLESLNGLPGPLIKWFLQTLGVRGLFMLAQRMGDDRAEARTFIGYDGADGDVVFFEGCVPGRIVEPRGESGFGWDALFQPEGFASTFAEMTPDEKNVISMRRAAVEKFRAHYSGLARS